MPCISWGTCYVGCTTLQTRRLHSVRLIVNALVVWTSNNTSNLQHKADRQPLFFGNRYAHASECSGPTPKVPYPGGQMADNKGLNLYLTLRSNVSYCLSHCDLVVGRHYNLPRNGVGATRPSPAQLFYRKSRLCFAYHRKHFSRARHKYIYP